LLSAAPAANEPFHKTVRIVVPSHRFPDLDRRDGADAVLELPELHEPRAQQERPGDVAKLGGVRLPADLPRADRVLLRPLDLVRLVEQFAFGPT